MADINQVSAVRVEFYSKKYDGLDPYNTGYAEKTEEPAPYVPDDVVEAEEIKDAQDIISQSFEPYDVTKDLNFDDEL